MRAEAPGQGWIWSRWDLQGVFAKGQPEGSPSADMGQGWETGSNSLHLPSLVWKAASCSFGERVLAGPGHLWRPEVTRMHMSPQNAE